jgi:hypothetical protein
MNRIMKILLKLSLVAFLAIAAHGIGIYIAKEQENSCTNEQLILCERPLKIEVACLNTDPKLCAAIENLIKYDDRFVISDRSAESPTKNTLRFEWRASGEPGSIRNLKLTIHSEHLEFSRVNIGLSAGISNARSIQYMYKNITNKVILK